MILRFNVPKKGFLILLITICFSSCGILHKDILYEVNKQTSNRALTHISKSQADSLNKIYGNNKIFVDDYVEPSLIALSYYPELKNVKITFKYSKESTTMAARPVILSLLGKRRYIILINNKKKFKGIHLKDVPFNAKIGIIGHELSHIADYESKSLASIIGISFRYLNKKHRILFERQTDRATIERGLGWQLYDWAEFSMFTYTGSSEKYREFKRKTYMNPEEIEELIFLLSKYSIPSQ